MARKGTLIPAFPVESRLLSWVLFGAGLVLLLAGWWRDSQGMLVLGGACAVGALIALVADRVLGEVEEDE
jgi:hypothetical protein